MSNRPIRPSSPARARSAAWLLVAIAGAAGCAAPADTAGRDDVDETQLVTLAGNVNPNAVPENDLGRVEGDRVFSHLQIVLRRLPEHEARAVAHIAAMHDPDSSEFHHFLTAEQFGALYGVPEADLQRVTRWLASHDIHVDSVPVSRMFIEVTATASALEEAFHTEIHHYQVGDEHHVANATEPKIPAALAGVVAGPHGLHDFLPHAAATRSASLRLHAPMAEPAPGQAIVPSQIGSPALDVTLSGATYQAVSPGDLATIYNLTPLFNAGILGTGQTIAVVSDSFVKNPSDVTTFRTTFGLASYHGTFTQMISTGSTACTKPTVNAAEALTLGGAEWAGAAAPDAAVVVAGCAGAGGVYGGLIALQNLLAQPTPPPIVEVLTSLCEASNGATANQNYVNTYQLAAALGVSVYAAAGDSGGAACDPGSASATHGIAVSGMASTPYNVAVGGTDFKDTYDSLSGGAAVNTYWAGSNGANLSSALSYIPETAWNNSCAGSLLYTLEASTQAYYSSPSVPGYCNTPTGKSFRTTTAGGGGPSAYSKQPAWQTGVVGLPTKSGAASPRYLPDVALFAGNGLWSHFYVICNTDTAQGGVPCDYTNETDVNALALGGTGLATAAMGGIQALINQAMGGPQGNPNPTFYKLAAAEHGAKGSTRCDGSKAVGGAYDPSCIFHDVTAGDTTVDCSAGSANCYGASGTANRGELSTSTTAPAAAFVAGTGWDYATGLGSIDAYNLVQRWSK